MSTNVYCIYQSYPVESNNINAESFANPKDPIPLTRARDGHYDSVSQCSGPVDIVLQDTEWKKKRNGDILFMI